jgi:hypothetical protein
VQDGIERGNTLQVAARQRLDGMLRGMRHRATFYHANAQASPALSRRGKPKSGV